MLATSVPVTVAIVIAVTLTGGWLVYALFNMRGGRREAGSEIELAANRKPYYDDDVLEGPKLTRTLFYGVMLLVVLAIGLPLYWMLEPARQRGAIDGFEEDFVDRGGALFDTTANGGFNCAGCHGGLKATGGSAAFTMTDSNTGEVKAVNWTAPALDTVLYRFSADEVRFIITYGRPFSPMSAWGLPGGGPLNEQQIDWLIHYLRSIQIQPVGCTSLIDDKFYFYAESNSSQLDPGICTGGEAPEESQQELQALAEADVASGKYATIGEALFNASYKGGSFSCARCHTRGWSYGNPQVSGGGAMGPNLTGGSEVRQCPTTEMLTEFVSKGSHLGAVYCQNGQGSGRMPGLGAQLSDDQLDAIIEYVRGL